MPGDADLRFSRCGSGDRLKWRFGYDGDRESARLLAGNQHGGRAVAHARIRAAQQRVAAGGLFCLRVNAAGTGIWPGHEVTGRSPDGGLTVRYLEGPKQGLLIHFFSAAGLGVLFCGGFTPVLPLRLHRTWRPPLQPGQWSQWEAIWRKNS
jgi:hypothetical protein